MKYITIAWVCIVSCFNGGANAQTGGSPPVSTVWVADNGDGTYTNPILFADYSDPDVVRVGDDYFLTASSFDAVPGLPILHSKDLVNWTIVGHALRRQPPYDHFSKTQHGNGVWAPSIRYHEGTYYIFWGDPDFGIYRVKTTDPFGEWEAPVLLEPAEGIIDVCPFWDEDGKAYITYAYAGSRAGIKSVLAIKRIDPEATQTLDEGVIIYDGHALDPTIEGPKFYKQNGYYYIFAPGGGVATGWQTVLRSKNVYGPYERRKVLHQGRTAVNGPHQGGWINTPTGEDWFIHFQDVGVYGRITHLQPMTWNEGWPVIGEDNDGDGIGEPVSSYRKPDVGKTHPIATPQESDEFDGIALGKQWQWQANPRATWSFLYPEKGVLRLYAQQIPEDSRNLYETPNVLMQKFPAPAFVATAKVAFVPHPDKLLGEKAGLVVMGRSYASLSVRKDADGLALVRGTAAKAQDGAAEEESIIARLDNGALYLRVEVGKGGLCHFRYSVDGQTYHTAGEPFQAVEGHWIGAKVGLYATRTATINDAGWLDVDWFRVSAARMPVHAQQATIDTVAEKMLLLQRSNGGWSKSFMGKAVNYQRAFSDRERAHAQQERDKDDTTIDNKATTREITYLLEAYQKTHNPHYKEAAMHGVEYLLSAQYDNGGWPQFYPDDRLYRSQITYNDDAMVNVLEVMDGISRGKGDYAALTDAYGAAAGKAVQQGVRCILATQVVLNGKKTIWAAQYDKTALTPATARTYELPSLAAAESANVLMFLMALEKPSEDVKMAIRHGVEWFTEHLIEGYAVEIVDAPDEPTKKDRILVKAPGERLWARFYDLAEQEPVFAGRDGHPHRQMDEIENERRVGYSWYGGWGDKVIRQYGKWRKTH